jgi:chemotaxis protein CheC
MNVDVGWDQILSDPQAASLLAAAMSQAARGLSAMMGRPISIEVPGIKRIPLSEVAAYAGGPETEVVGVYLLTSDSLPGQVMLIVSLDDALHLVDLLAGAPAAAASPRSAGWASMSGLERSALAEAGNLTVSYFLNALAEMTGISARPSPPAVIMDMLGVIVDIIAAPVAATSDELLIVETVFKEDSRAAGAHFWVLPDPPRPEGDNSD